MNTNNILRRLCILFSIALFALGSPGCNGPTETAEPVEVETQPLDEINILVVGDELIGPAIKRQWAAQRDGQLTFSNQTLDEFVQSDFEISEKVDVVIYPPRLLGDLVTKSQLANVPKDVWGDTEYFNSQEILKHNRSTLVRYGKETWAVPLGSPQPVMFYRDDVLKQLGMPAPDSWAEFDKIVKALGSAGDLKDENGNELPTEVAFPLQGDGACMAFLERAAAYVRSRGKLTILFDRKGMTPLLETPPFIKALEELKATVGTFEEDSALDARQVYKDMVEGKLAIGFAWPSGQFTRAEDGTPFDESKIIEAVQIARIPGSSQWFDGGDRGWADRDKADSMKVDVIGFDGFLASVNQRSGHSLTAFEFIKWLPNKLISLKTMTESSTSGPFRASHLGDPGRWTGQAISPDTAQQYADVIGEIHSDNVVFVFPRIPGSTRYFDALNEQIQKCLSGEIEAEAALKSAAQAWEDITEELGRKKQLVQLRKSQGI